MYRVRSGLALALALAVIGTCAHAERASSRVVRFLGANVTISTPRR